MPYLKKIILFVICVFILIVFSSNVHSTQQTIINTDSVMQIEVVETEIILFDNNFTMHWHVFNSSGLPLNNITTQCILHIYNFTNGRHILEAENVGMDSNLIDYEYTVDSSIFERNGIYYRLIQCNSTGEGGYYGDKIKVGYSEREGSIQEAMIYIMLIFFILTFLVLSIVYMISIDSKNKLRLLDNGKYSLDINYGFYIKVALADLNYTLMWCLSYFLWQISNIFLLSNILTEIFRILFIVLTVALFPAIILSVMVCIFRIINDSEINRKFMRGFKP